MCEYHFFPVINLYIVQPPIYFLCLHMPTHFASSHDKLPPRASAPWRVGANIVIQVMALALVHTGFPRAGPQWSTVLNFKNNQPGTLKHSKQFFQNMLTMLTMLKILKCRAGANDGHLHCVLIFNYCKIYSIDPKLLEV